MEKSGSSSRNASQAVVDNQGDRKQDEPAPDRSPTRLSPVMEAVDRFIEAIKVPPASRIPDEVETFPEMVDSMVSVFESSKFGMKEDEHCSFVDAVNRLSKLVNKLRESESDSSSVASCLSRAATVQGRAVTLLDEEFRRLLENSNRSSHDNADQEQNHKGTPKTQKKLSFSKHEPDRCILPEPRQKSQEEKFPDLSPETISAIARLAGALILAGNEAECCMVYEIRRREALKEELSKLGFEKINVDNVQKITWDALESEIAVWISVVRHCSTVLFPGERDLCEAVFSSCVGHPSVYCRLFSSLTSPITIRFLDFPSAVVHTKQSSEKLFKLLDMHEALRDLAPTVAINGHDDQDLNSKISMAQVKLGETAVSIFSELENSIKNDNGRIPVPSGSVHPLTRYTMNYLKYACEYKDTLDQVLQKKVSSDHNDGPNPNETEDKKPENHQEEDNDGKPKTSPFAIQLISVMELLDGNIEMKSKLYKDPSLRHIFRMNNGRYILQKIKGSQEIRDIMGQSWTRKRSSELRQYHKSYQRETWGPLLQCISQEGLQVNGKVVKTVLKERFKSFNTLFDEIHRTQSTWVVCDEQLQSELRVSVSAVVTPAYRSFFGRFRQHIAEKNIKYQPEDIETLIEELFDGNPTSMARRRN